MARFQRRYRCPDCAGAFVWSDADDLPEYCPKCGSYLGTNEPPDFVPKAPAIGRAFDSAEAVYRAMEESSIARSKIAAAELGIPESETAHMKMTDMKDNLRPGDIAAVTRPNPTSTFMQQNAPAVAAAQAQGAAYAAATTSGPYPRAGDNIRRVVGDRHAANVAAVVASGKRG